MLKISSLQNSRVKSLVKLSKRRERDQRQATLVEGGREITRLLAANIWPQEVYVCPELLEPETERALHQVTALAAGAKGVAAPDFFEVTSAVFAKIAYRASGGLLLVIPYVNRALEQLTLREPPLVVIIEGVEKPGNLGAILRTADAVGVDAVIVCAGATDLHNPNVVRASLGALFTLPIVEATSEALFAWLAAHHIQLLAADPAATVAYTAYDCTVPLAVAMGSEAHGLSSAWLQRADAVVTIPMHGVVDSLNLSAATAVVLYEVLRQREHLQR